MFKETLQTKQTGSRFRAPRQNDIFKKTAQHDTRRTRRIEHFIFLSHCFGLSRKFVNFSITSFTTYPGKCMRPNYFKLNELTSTVIKKKTCDNVTKYKHIYNVLLSYWSWICLNTTIIFLKNRNRYTVLKKYSFLQS